MFEPDKQGNQADKIDPDSRIQTKNKWGDRLVLGNCPRKL